MRFWPFLDRVAFAFFVNGLAEAQASASTSRWAFFLAAACRMRPAMDDSSDWSFSFFSPPFLIFSLTTTSTSSFYPTSTSSCCAFFTVMTPSSCESTSPKNRLAWQKVGVESTQSATNGRLRLQRSNERCTVGGESDYFTILRTPIFSLLFFTCARRECKLPLVAVYRTSDRRTHGSILCSYAHTQLLVRGSRTQAIRAIGKGLPLCSLSSKSQTLSSVWNLFCMAASMASAHSLTWNIKSTPAIRINQVRCRGYISNVN